MADYWQVKAMGIQVLGWFTRDQHFAEAYLQKYNAATSLTSRDLGVTKMALSLMAHPVNEHVGGLVQGWKNMGVIDLANCGATNVGEFIEFLCNWGSIQIPMAEPT